MSSHNGGGGNAMSICGDWRPSSRLGVEGDKRPLSRPGLETGGTEDERFLSGRFEG